MAGQTFNKSFPEKSTGLVTAGVKGGGFHKPQCVVRARKLQESGIIMKWSGDPETSKIGDENFSG